MEGMGGRTSVGVGSWHGVTRRAVPGDSSQSRISDVCISLPAGLLGAFPQVCFPSLGLTDGRG